MTDYPPSDTAFDPNDPLVTAWADQGEADGPSLSSDPAALADSVAGAHRKDRRRLWRITIQEVSAGLIPAAVFSWNAPETERPAAMLVAAALGLAAVGFLAFSSIIHERDDRSWGSSVRDQLARRLAQVEHGAWMYRHIAWWYLAPIGLAIVLVRYAVGGPLGLFDLAYFGICVALFAVLYWWNRRIGRTRYESEVERLKPLLAEFDRG